MYFPSVVLAETLISVILFPYDSPSTKLKILAVSQGCQMITSFIQLPFILQVLTDCSRVLPATAVGLCSCLSIADTSPQVYGADSVRRQLPRYPGKPQTPLGSLPLRFRLQRPLFQDCVGEGCSDPMGNCNSFSETNTITV